MSIIDQYRARLIAEGATPGVAYTNATIHAINASFANAPNFRNIPVDLINTDVRILDIKSSQQGNQVLSFTKELLFRPFVVRRSGTYAVIDGRRWLLFDFRGGIVPKAIIHLCNATLTIQIGVTRVIRGHDEMNRPVFTNTPIIRSWDCIIDNKMRIGTGGLNDAINMPEGVMNIIIPHTTEVVESKDTRFVVWGQNYQIISINYQYILNNEGPMVITAQRVV
ncbi:MAG: hypothetical protein DDT31_01889 [Syntrophomonadaceae bacterium]|nr:hypothetical protein [Bacillota bacterium]